MEYLAAFIITGLLAFFPSAKKMKRGLRIFFCALSVMPLCVLAALRDASIGTDLMVYVEPAFYSSFYVGITNFEYTPSPVFGVFTWVISHAFDSMQVYLFMIQLVINGLIYAEIYRSCKRYAWFGITVFNLIFFGYTLNLIRQSMAMAICLFSLRYACKRKPIPFFVLQFLACGVHETALVFLPTYLLFGQKRPVRQLRDSGYLKFWGIVGAFVVVLLVPILLNIVPSLQSEYQYQLTNSGSDSIGMLVVFCAFVLVFVILGKRDCGLLGKQRMSLGRRSFASDCGFCLIVGCVLYLLAYISKELFRISMYYFMFLPLYCADIAASLSAKKDRNLFCFAVLLLACLFWVWKFVHQNVGNIFPYVPFFQ
ncbi:EpsG family protein [Adlercreutzia murintestinalis]|jgi:hypothetical protein|uniref:EpsG family protein n=1 Tax=Adlercreutzia murintestinalis TaxID=2941325 RepID=UPI00203C2466|nr:EpsG family protein [Adlercreutzia murintestinalis]